MLWRLNSAGIREVLGFEPDGEDTFQQEEAGGAVVYSGDVEQDEYSQDLSYSQPELVMERTLESITPLRFSHEQLAENQDRAEHSHPQEVQQQQHQHQHYEDSDIDAERPAPSSQRVMEAITPFRMTHAEEPVPVTNPPPSPTPERTTKVKTSGKKPASKSGSKAAAAPMPVVGAGSAAKGKTKKKVSLKSAGRQRRSQEAKMLATTTQDAYDFDGGMEEEEEPPARSAASKRSSSSRRQQQSSSTAKFVKETPPPSEVDEEFDGDVEDNTATKKKASMSGKRVAKSKVKGSTKAAAAAASAAVRAMNTSEDEEEDEEVEVDEEFEPVAKKTSKKTAGKSTKAKAATASKAKPKARLKPSASKKKVAVASTIESIDPQTEITASQEKFEAELKQVEAISAKKAPPNPRRSAAKGRDEAAAAPPTTPAVGRGRNTAATPRQYTPLTFKAQPKKKAVTAGRVQEHLSGVSPIKATERVQGDPTSPASEIGSPELDALMNGIKYGALFGLI
jgi:hypothetical protein